MTAVQPITGPTGAAGAGGEAYDLWANTASPTSVTDWGAKLNTAFGAGHKHIVLRNPADLTWEFDVTTKIDLTGTLITGVLLQGAGARSWDRISQGPTKLVWKGGAGSGTMIDLRSSSGVTIDGFAILYDSTAYNGDLIDMGFSSGSQASGHTIRNCTLGSTGSAVRSARSLLRLESGVGHTFRDLTLSGATCLVRGAETGSTVSNQMLFVNCMFDKWTNGAIANGGEGWEFLSCCWEFPNCPAGARGFITDATWAGNFAPNIYLGQGCSFWDYNQTGQGLITTTAANGTIYFTLRDVQVNSATTNAIIAPSAGGLTLENVTGWGGLTTGTGPYIDLTGTAKSWVIIRDCPQFNVSGADLDELIHGLTAGHSWIDVWGQGATELSRGMRTLQGYERLSVSNNSWAKPSIAAAAGQTGLTVSVKGNDYKGVIVLTGTANAGELATVSYPKTLIGGFLNLQHILLGLPIQGWDGNTINPDIFYSSQVYAKVIGTNDLTGFKVACVTGWTSKTLAIPYEVAVFI